MPFSRRSWLPVVALLGPLFFFVNFVKLWKLKAITNGWSFGYWYDMVRWDWLVLMTLALTFLCFLEFAGRKMRFALLGILSLMSLSLLVMTAVEHGFFLITGTPGDWFLLKYGMQKLTDPATLRVFINQAMGPKIVLLLLPFALVFGPLLMMRRPRLRGWIESGEKERYDAPRWMAWGVPLMLMFLLLPPVRTLPGDLKVSSNNVVWFLFKGWASDVVLRNNREVKVPSNLPSLFSGSSVKLVKTPAFKKRNVVFVVLESIRARSITPYNPALKTTPFLNKIAKQSWQVQHMTATLPHTSKALVTMLCGIYPKITQPIHEGNVQGIPTRCLARLLQEQGYNTAFFQSATVGFEKRAQLVANMGYKTLVGHEDMSTKGFSKTNYFGYEDHIMLKPSMRWIDKQKKNPFFMTYLLLVSHHTYTTPRSFRSKKYTNSRDPELNKYLNSLRYVDNFLRDLFAEYKKRGLLDKTLFVLVGDHGEAFSEHKRRQHDNIMWDEGLHVPALFYAPGLIKEKKLIKGRRTQVDLLPSIVKLLGFSMKGGQLPGIPVQSTVKKDRETYHSCWYQHQCMALRKGPLKYIYHYNRRAWEVYNLHKDPLEKKNLASGPGFSPLALRKIEKKMLLWKARVNQSYNQFDEKRRKYWIRKKQPPVQMKAGVKIGKYMKLVGVNLHSRPLERGGTLDVSLVFKSLKTIPRRRKLFFHVNIKPPRGTRFARNIKVERFLNADHVPVGGAHPEYRWKPGTFIIDRHRVRIPGYFPEGTRVSLFIGLWARKRPRSKLVNTSAKFYDDGKRRLHVVTLILKKPTSTP